MTITATNSIAPLPSLTPVQARQVASASTGSQTQASTPQTLTYASPIFQFDNLANIPIEIFRDPTTGATTNQIPPEQVVKKYELGQLKSSANGGTQANTTAATAAAGTAGATSAAGQATTAATASVAAVAAAGGVGGTGATGATASVSIRV